MTSPAAPRAKSEPISVRRPLLAVFLALSAGIVADRFVEPWGVLVWLLLGWLALAAWMAAERYRCFSTATCVLLVAVAALGGAYHHLVWNLFSDNEIGSYARLSPQPVCLEAVVLDAPREVPAPKPHPLCAIAQSDQTRLSLAAVRLRDCRQWKPVCGRTELTVSGQLPGVHAGDRVRVFGQLEATSPPQSPGGFDYAAHQRVERRLCRLRADYPDCVEPIAAAGRGRPRRILESFSVACRDLLRRHIDPEVHGIASAVLLGRRETLDPDETEAFFRTGTIHILTVSGLHIGMLAAAIMLIGRLLSIPPRWFFPGLIGLVVLYVLLTGSNPPVVRAAVLIVLGCVGQLLYRRPITFNTLAAAGLIVLALNPALLFRSGVQLSFLAVATLGWFGPWLIVQSPSDPLDRLIAQSRPWPLRATRHMGEVFWKLFLAGLLIQAVATPLVLYQFHLLSAVAVVLNPLLWFPVMIALLSGFATILLAWIATPLAGPMGGICNSCFHILQNGVTMADSLPGSSLWLPGPALWWVLGFYGYLTLCAFWQKGSFLRRWLAVFLAVWIVAGVAASHRVTDRLFPPPDGQVEAQFLPVGHGTAIVVRLPDGRTLLYDAGSMSHPERTTRTIAAALWQRGVTHLDAVVLSHADLDHYNALPDLLDRFSVGVVYVSPFMFENKTSSLEYLENAIRTAGVPIRPIVAGDRLETSEPVRIEVMHPPRHSIDPMDNSNSLVLHVETSGRGLLLTGDLEPPGLTDLPAELPRRCEVAAAPHHGSAGSNPAGLIEWCRPRWIVISGADRPEDDPRVHYAGADCKVYHTAHDGAVRVELRPDGTRVEGFSHGGWR